MTENRTAEVGVLKLATHQLDLLRISILWPLLSFRSELRGGQIATFEVNPLERAPWLELCGEQVGVLQVTLGYVRILREKDAVQGVRTSAGRFSAPVVVDAAGADSRELSAALGCNIAVTPESHEAGISEPVQMFCPAMVVDLRPAPGSRNYYFYQNRHGQVVFCITPEPPLVGHDYRETSGFLPQVCARMVDLMPRLKNLRVRRVWRGLYPMTADGVPLVGWNRDVSGLLHAVGMCGQGFMLGPGLGELLARMITGASIPDDRVVLEGFSLYRDLTCGMEALK